MIITNRMSDVTVDYVTENGVNSNCQIILHRMFMDFL